MKHGATLITFILGITSFVHAAQFNVSDNGAVPDSKEGFNCAVAAGSTTLVCQDVIFASTDVARAIAVYGAVANASTNSKTAVSAGSITVTPASMAHIAVGSVLYCANADGSRGEQVVVAKVSGSTFTATFRNSKNGTWIISSSYVALYTTIVSIAGASTATLAAPATQTVNSTMVQVVGATDNLAAIQNVVNMACSAATPGSPSTISFPPGIYGLSNTLFLPNGCSNVVWATTGKVVLLESAILTSNPANPAFGQGGAVLAFGYPNSPGKGSSSLSDNTRIGSGTNVLHCGSGCGFTTADIGQPLYLQYGGDAGMPLWTEIIGVSGTPTGGKYPAVTLASNAQTTLPLNPQGLLAGAAVVWGYETIQSIDIGGIDFHNIGYWFQPGFTPVGYPLVTFGTAAQIVKQGLKFHDSTLISATNGCLSNNGPNDQFLIQNVTCLGTSDAAFYMAGFNSNGTISDVTVDNTQYPIANTALWNAFLLKGLSHVLIDHPTVRCSCFDSLIDIGDYASFATTITNGDFNGEGNTPVGIESNITAQLAVENSKIQGIRGNAFRFSNSQAGGINGVTLTGDTVVSSVGAIWIKDGSNTGHGPSNIFFENNNVQVSGNAINVQNVEGTNFWSSNQLVNAPASLNAAWQILQGSAGAINYVSTNTVSGFRGGSVCDKSCVAGTSYTLTLGTAPAAAGSITASPASPDATYVSGTKVCLGVTPSAGWAFSQWSGTTLDASNCLVMNANRSVTATFKQVAYTLALTALPLGSGTVTATPSASDGTYAAGTKVCLTASPNVGWGFNNWSGATLSSNCLAISVNSTVTANMTPGPNLISASQGSGQGAIIGSGFATGLLAHVTNTNGVPVPNFAVTFTSPSSGASGTFPGSQLTATVLTDASGNATALPFAANLNVGNYNVKATVAGASASALFSLSNKPLPNQLPTADSVSPSSGSGASQLFSLTYSDASGYLDLNEARVLFNANAATNNACYVRYYPAANLLYLMDDTGATSLGPLTPGGTGSVQNTQCTLNAGGSSVSSSGNSITVKVSLSFKVFLGPKNIYMLAMNNEGLSSGWQSRGSWTPNADAVPTADSVVPSSGAGVSQVFTMTYSDASGYLGLNEGRVLFNTNAATNNACYVRYYVPINALYLMDDTGSTSLGPLTPGVAGSVQNTQCTLNASGSSVSFSGNSMTVKVSLTFKTAFLGPKNTYTLAINNEGIDSGWQLRGSWTPNADAVPTADSVNPSSGAGGSQVFTMTYSDASGYLGLNEGRVLFNTNAATNNACYVRYNVPINALYLMDDTGSTSLGPLTPGVAGSVQNTQCTLNASGSSVSFSGNSMTVKVSLSFNVAFLGPKNTYIWAINNEGINSGWQLRGSWTPNADAVPTADSVSPSSGAGVSQVFTMTYSDASGYLGLNEGRVLFNTNAATNNACYVRYYVPINALYLMDDTGSTSLGPLTPGVAGSVQNSQCMLNAGGSSVSFSGNSMAVKVSLSFKTAFLGPKNTYMLAINNEGIDSGGWQLRGSWTPNADAVPTADSVSPSSGAGVSQVFTMTYSDASGYLGLNEGRVLFNTNAATNNACYVRYVVPINALYLMDDTGSTSLGPLTPAGTGSVQNSQCTLNASGSSVLFSGNSMTVKVSLSFKTAFLGPKNTYMWAINNEGVNSGWQLRGSWTPNADAVPTADSVSPSSGAGVSQVFTMTYSDASGYLGLNEGRVLFNTNAATNNACYVRYYVPINALYLMDDTGSISLGPLTPGGTGSVQNSQCTLNAGGSSVVFSGNSMTVKVSLSFNAAFLGPKNTYMLAINNEGVNSGWQLRGSWTPNADAVPTADSVSPSSGAGVSQVFTVTYSDASGYSGLNEGRLLFNTNTATNYACYVRYFATTNALYLMDDTGSKLTGPLTPGVAGSVQNTQCALNASGSSVSFSGNSMTVKVSLSFNAGFLGSKNVYLFAINNEGLNSGWQLRATWTP